MRQFLFTFGTEFDETGHPCGIPAHSQGWITVFAEDEYTARVAFINRYSNRFSSVYTPSQSNGSTSRSANWTSWTSDPRAGTPPRGSGTSATSTAPEFRPGREYTVSVTFAAFAGDNLVADELAVNMSAATCRTALYLLGLSADFTGEVSPGVLVKAGDAYITRVNGGYSEPSELVAVRVRELLALAARASDMGATVITWG